MVFPKCKRRADPVIVQQLWTGISYIRQQKQIPNTERLTKYMQRVHNMKQFEAELHLQNAVDDKLVLSYTAVGFKGSKVGLEQEGFRIPDRDTELDKYDHDWYCFDCHQAGEVVGCEECWRVYHPACMEEDWTFSDNFICSVCMSVKKKPRMKRKEVNRLLGYTIIRLKDKTKDLHTFRVKEETEQLRVDRLMFKYMDLNAMESKIKDRKYKYLEQFYCDCRTILHNVFICFGDTGLMSDLAKIMIKDCKYDLEEIRQCKYCYHYSNAKPKDWFCQPCKPPHMLVFAKQKGFCHWPAKVIRMTKEGADVRFFGGWHQRAIVAESSLKPIDVNIKTLNIKRTAGFVKSMSELARHQQLLEKLTAEIGGGSDKDDEEEDDREEFEKEDVEPQPKKFHYGNLDEESEATSTSGFQGDKLASTPEDVNLVTSSEDNIHPLQRTFSTSDIGVQTSRKLLQAGKASHKSVQTDLEVAASNCQCETKYNKIINDFVQRMEKSNAEDKDRALKELEDGLRKDFESDKSQAVSRAVTNMQREMDRTRRHAEDRCKEQYLDEIKKVTQKHKTEVSNTKKKQWCYNCEEEAMYHCCWNTSYCSIKCQQEHWHREHKRMCRRKRT